VPFGLQEVDERERERRERDGQKLWLPGKRVRRPENGSSVNLSGGRRRRREASNADYRPNK
jgi:hypothetical protein